MPFVSLTQLLLEWYRMTVARDGHYSLKHTISISYSRCYFCDALEFGFWNVPVRRLSRKMYRICTKNQTNICRTIRLKLLGIYQYHCFMAEKKSQFLEWKKKIIKSFQMRLNRCWAHILLCNTDNKYSVYILAILLLTAAMFSFRCSVFLIACHTIGRPLIMRYARFCKQRFGYRTRRFYTLFFSTKLYLWKIIK